MDPMSRVRDYLLDNVGHMTYPGNASFDPTTQHWYVPVYCRAAQGGVVVGDVEVDGAGRIIYAPSRDAMLARFERTTTVSPTPAAGVP